MRSAQLWQRARRARDDVERRLMRRPEVLLIDLGATADDVPVIQVHVDRALDLEAVLPGGQVDGFAVRVLPAAAFRPE